MNFSPFEGFSRLDLIQRVERVKQFANLSVDEVQTLLGSAAGKTRFGVEEAERFIENVVGVFPLPLGVATHFVIDGVDRLIPMAVEETSIVAAASAAAKWVRASGGFSTKILGKLIIGQIQFYNVDGIERFQKLETTVLQNKSKLIQMANDVVAGLVRRGGGVTDMVVRRLDHGLAVVHVLCDPCDAMGANLINQVCEALKQPLEELTGERIGLCILSNLVDSKLVEATCVIKNVDAELGVAIERATLFAHTDPYRGATHNKGVMNGIDPILIATGNDWRAVEAGIHAYVALGGRYRAITEWKYKDGALHGRFCAPLAVGTVGGVTKLHPTAQVCLKLLKIEHADELARICAAAGLAQNLAALRALCSEGIIKGHMRLHSANLALASGATESEMDPLVRRLRAEPSISLSRAKELLAELRASLHG